jgi:crotonobetainyl-CoA:carnitine CoA-transferase CaiB-like acyl-CoA transferase
MTVLSHKLTKLAWSAIDGNASAADDVVFTGHGGLGSAFPVTDVASAAVATAALAVAELVHAIGHTTSVTVDRRLSSIWFSSSIRPIGWRLPAPWDPIAGDYRTRDGWIRLHTNAPHHRAAAEHVLGVRGDKEAVARAVAHWAKADLETAVVEAAGCAAEMRSTTEWRRHPQGRAVAAEPLVHIFEKERGTTPTWPLSAARPLQGVRVLDLTRVLAGPVASRFLAGYGADVLRIDPPGWDEPGVVPDMTLGKRCARLDLRDTGDRVTFEALLAKADILLHGYRPGALDGLGFGAAARHRLSPGLIDVCLDAYGWSGPLATRRGFDSLVQMSAGIAEAGMRTLRAENPIPLPVQALDHATGYLMAAVAIRGVTRRLREGSGTQACLSLARTAMLLIDQPRDHAEPQMAQESETDWSPTIEVTEWGDTRRVAPPAQVDGAVMTWVRPACGLGSAEPRWGESQIMP